MSWATCPTYSSFALIRFMASWVIGTSTALPSPKPLGESSSEPSFEQRSDCRELPTNLGSTNQAFFISIWFGHKAERCSYISPHSRYSNRKEPTSVLRSSQEKFDIKSGHSLLMRNSPKFPLLWGMHSDPMTFPTEIWSWELLENVFGKSDSKNCLKIRSKCTAIQISCFAIHAMSHLKCIWMAESTTTFPNCWDPFLHDDPPSKNGRCDRWTGIAKRDWLANLDSDLDIDWRPEFETESHYS